MEGVLKEGEERSKGGRTDIDIDYQLGLLRACVRVVQCSTATKGVWLS